MDMTGIQGGVDAANEEFGLTAVLLVNTGTPDAPTKAAVKPYLKGFLSDRRIVNLPPLIWKPILNGIVLRARPHKTVAIYQSIWTAQGSPYMLYSQALEQGINAKFASRSGNKPFLRLVHRYGNPTMALGLAQCQEQGIKRVVVIPLYPQEAFATTGSVQDELDRQLAKLDYHPEVDFVQNYYDAPEYLGAVVEHLRAYLTQKGERGQKDSPRPSKKLLFSYHSIPLKDKRHGDPYEEQVIETSQKVATQLGLEEGEWDIVYQSRFDDQQKWLGPFLADEAKRLIECGVTELTVFCPGFAADCTETLYDIEQKLRNELADYARKQGSAAPFVLRYIPALNDSPVHVTALSHIIEKYL
jgi:ferrochelatase